MTNFDRIYLDVVKDILDRGEESYNERSGFYCKAVPGMNLKIDLSVGFPLLTLRKMYIKTFVAEQVWFLMGENSPEWINKYTKIWNDFIEEDGKVTSYGYRWRKHFKRDQLGDLIKHLKDKPGSRQGVVIAWDPDNDGLLAKPRKNVPCLIAFTVNIIGGKVCLHNILRSQDVFLGMPYDIAGFALLQHIIAQELGLPVGTYSHSISNAHFYSDQYDAANEMLKRDNTEQQEIKINLPENTLQRAEKGDETLIPELIKMFEDQYKPLEAISGIKTH